MYICTHCIYDRDLLDNKLVCPVQFTFVRIASTTETCIDNELVCPVQCTFVRIASTTETCLDNKMICPEHPEMKTLELWISRSTLFNNLHSVDCRSRTANQKPRNVAMNQ